MSEHTTHAIYYCGLHKRNHCETGISHSTVFILPFVFQNVKINSIPLRNNMGSASREEIRAILGNASVCCLIGLEGTHLHTRGKAKK